MKGWTDLLTLLWIYWRSKGATRNFEEQGSDDCTKAPLRRFWSFPIKQFYVALGSEGKKTVTKSAHIKFPTKRAGVATPLPNPSSSCTPAQLTSYFADSITNASYHTYPHKTKNTLHHTAHHTRSSHSFIPSFLSSFIHYIIFIHSITCLLQLSTYWRIQLN